MATPSHQISKSALSGSRRLVSGIAVLVALCLVQVGQAEEGPRTYKTLSLEQLMDIDVTSVSRRPEKLSETASAIQVVTDEEIQRSGATSLPEALRLATNLQVAQIDSSQWAISARGFNNRFADKMLVMIDGRTVYTPLFAGVYWDVQDTFMPDIERIEVISGPGATQWGGNAVNGVINVSTKSAKDTQGLLVEAGGGNELRQFGGLRYGGELAPNLHYRAYGKYFQRDDVVLSNGDDAEDDWHMGRGGFMVDWDASEIDLFRVQGDIYNGEIEEIGPSSTEVRGGNGMARWTHSIATNSDTTTKVYYDRTYRQIPNSITETLDTYDADFLHRFPIGRRNAVVWGLNYRIFEDQITNPPTSGFLPAHVTREKYGAFAQDEVAVVLDQVFVTLGSKFEHNDYSGFEVQPSLRTAWRLTEDQTVWSAVSRAVRTPSRVDVEHYVPSTGPFILQGGPNFDSEKLIAYELGYRARLHEQVTTALSLYYNDYDDLRSVEELNPPAPIPLIIGNGFTGESYGFEFSIEYQMLDWCRLTGGYNEMRVHLRPKASSTDSDTDAEDPSRMFSLRSSLDLPHRWQCDAMFRYVSEIEIQNLPSYEELDLRVGWLPVDSFELSVVGQSLLHDDHAEFGSPTQRREIERSIYGKMVWQF